MITISSIFSRPKNFCSYCRDIIAGRSGEQKQFSWLMIRKGCGHLESRHCIYKEMVNMKI